MHLVLFSPKVILKSDVEALWAIQPRRICFASTHRDQPKRSAPPHVGKFEVPFDNTVGRQFEADTGLTLRPSKFQGVWRPIQSEDEFVAIQNWTARQGTRVFIRDCLDMSVALDVNLVDNQSGQYTELGALEARAKARQDDAAVQELAQACYRAICNLSGYRDARYVASVPARLGKGYDLPAAIADRVSALSGLENVTNRFTFAHDKGALKGLPLDQKWDALEKAGLTFSPNLPRGASIILIDDKYQSGVTMQFVASRLYLAGASEVLGLCVVKTLRDTDNQ
ncbi:hypothetical protein MTBLM5_20109 [Magnetospirillum sp. LM-5]|uniref:hypothetical protein n=1 Tax=Magnetospirillum sp. LM-5 TaxID=2681466 RepID=UPI00138380AD|nr:hypothetical protein [Magnetospirillum sp. LM-5]CAA7616485.1 hypothetical protein MTBLM5_20109 [Magnetospirillum sp. LM-5]